MGRAFFCIAVSALAWAAQSPAAKAQSKLVIDAGDMVRCADMTADAERLACYDELAKKLDLVEAADKDKNVLYALAGEGDADSEPFSATQPWVLQWTFKGSIVSFELRDDHNELLHSITQQIGDGSGRSDPIGPGSYIIAIRGLGSWDIKAVPAN